MKAYLGAVSGFLFGIVNVFLATLGLISIAVETLFPVLFPVGYLFRSLELSFSGMLPIAILLNGLLFAAVGYALQRWQQVTKRSERVVPYLFLAVIGLVLLLLAFEQLVRGLSA